MRCRNGAVSSQMVCDWAFDNWSLPLSIADVRDMDVVARVGFDLSDADVS